MKYLLQLLFILMIGNACAENNLAPITLIWPSNGQILSKFDSNKKGIQIAGVLGSPVVAAANGRVVYAGNTLKGYGNLIILKHDNTYLTTYAHNSKLLVKEGDTVRQGEKIAELGSTDSTEPKLQFEVRVNGKAVDPELFLNRQVVVEHPQDKNENRLPVLASQQDDKFILKCKGSNISQWNNCVGAYTYSKETSPIKYVGEWINGSPGGQGMMIQNFDLICSKEASSGRKTYSDCVASYGGITRVREGIWSSGTLLTSREIDSKLKQFLLSEVDLNETSSPTMSNVAITSNSPPSPAASISTLPTPSSSTLSTSGRRLALVIGNATYKVRPLLNPRNDADDVSKVLRNTGFEVIDLRDATLAQMRAAVRQFGERLMSNDVGLVYYSGHGIEVRGKNYFIPVNADIKASDEVADQALDVSLILAKMDTAKKGVNILIVDACRDDPFGRSFRSNSRGLATMDAPQGTLIAYATAPGSVAADGTGRNSPFTKHLVRAMQVPNTPIELMFKEVRRAVREETKNQQTPWENSSLIGNFYFSVKK